MKRRLLVLGMFAASLLLAGCGPPRYWHDGYGAPRYHDRDHRDHDRDHDRDRGHRDDWRH